MEAPVNTPSRAPSVSPAPAPAPTAPPSALPRSPFPDDPYPRLSLSPPARITLGSTVSAVVGFALGATQGGQTAQLRFRAEHAHKMPDSTTGWYLYHKSKNYHVMFGGLREGFRMAARTSVWTLMALSLESTVDRCRGTSDLFSTVIASLTVAGTFSLWNRFTFSTAARTAKSGLVFGLAYGGVQDMLSAARGRQLGYVEFVRRGFRSPSSSPGAIEEKHL